MTIAFFDFDGTITKKDSFLDFIAFTHGKRKLFTGLLKHTLAILGYKLNLVSGTKIKELLLSYFYKGLCIDEFKKFGFDYSQNRLPEIISPLALQRLLWHKDNGHKVVVVTASVSEWIRHWCDQQKIDLIATELLIKDNKLTGKIKGENCNGIEKVNRIKEKYELRTISYSYAYGNSIGDKELLTLADEKFYKIF
ncbi:HAD family hydrolase [Aquimarina sp. M1]